ncbi:MAG: tetratricopeptide repeat protein [Rhizobiaceae bacterium]
MSIRTDLFGCPVSISPKGDLEAWNKTQLGFLSHAASTPEDLGKALASDPDFALPIICKGIFSLLMGRRELYEIAQQAEKDARAAMNRRTVTSREIIFFDVLCDMNLGNLKTAADRLDLMAISNPNDALAMKLVQSLRFILGDAIGMRSSIAHILPHMHKDHSAYGYALGCQAFALEETGDYRGAEKCGREAVAHSPNDAWGLHAVAHVYDMTNNTKAGLDWLQNRTSAWKHCNNFSYHVWWHMALMHLDRGEIDAVFALYDDYIRKEKTDDYRDIANGTALLSRLELEGHNVGYRWEELADLSEGRTQDGCLAFADLHYMLALIGGNRKKSATRLLARMRKGAVSEANEMEMIIKHPGLSAAQGLEAFGEGNYTQAFKHLANARERMQTVGGSHAQRDVFERLTIEAALRGGYLDAAERFLNQRTKLRDGHKDQFSVLRFEEINRLKNFSPDQTTTQNVI